MGCCVVVCAARASHDSPRTPNVHILGTNASKHHQNSTRRHPERGKKKRKWRGGRGNKRKFLCSPPFGAQLFLGVGPTLRGPTLRFPSLWGPTDTQHKNGLAKIGRAKTRMAKNGLAQRELAKLVKSGWPKMDWPKSVSSREGEVKGGSREEGKREVKGRGF